MKRPPLPQVAPRVFEIINIPKRHLHNRIDTPDCVNDFSVFLFSIILTAWALYGLNCTSDIGWVISLR
jgi:hypothetical protein